MHGRDAGVLQLAGDPRLAEEALGGYRIGRVALGQQLDGDIAIEGGVAGAIDDAHAAVADLVEQFVARRAGGGAIVSAATFPGSPEVWIRSSAMVLPSVLGSKLEGLGLVRRRQCPADSRGSVHDLSHCSSSPSSPRGRSWIVPVSIAPCTRRIFSVTRTARSWTRRDT